MMQANSSSIDQDRDQIYLYPSGAPSPSIGATGAAKLAPSSSSSSSRTTRSKNRVLAQPGRAPWYTLDGVPLDAYVIGIAGGSASGKTRVAQEILRALRVPSVLVVSQDSFYKSLSPEQSKLAFLNEYDFDSPAAFDWNTLRDCIGDLKKGKAVEIPVYSFVLHQRTEETQYLYGASVVILEGIFVLSDPDLRDLMDMKIFVQCDSDLMLARRIRRDTVERGRDVQGIIDQYLRYVKPSFDATVQPMSRHADVIVPGASNEVAIDLITNHIKRQLRERALSHRTGLTKQPALTRTASGAGILPSTVYVLEQTPQMKGMQTILRNRECSREDFIHFSTRLSTLIVEEALRLLPYAPKDVHTPQGTVHHGHKLDAELCGVSILRSGQCFERGLRRVIRDAVLGSLLIQQDDESGEPLLFNTALPPRLKSRKTAGETFVLLFDSQIGTAAACIMAIRVLLDHGVKEEHIIFCCFVIARDGGVHAVARAFPNVRIVTSAVDPGLEERTIPIQYVDPKTQETRTASKKCWAILPGVGNFGNRYFGTQS